MIDTRIQFGNRLREERERLGLTQKEFAEIGGVKRVSQHLYERGDTPPNIDYLLRLAEIDVDVAYLLIGERQRAMRAKKPLGQGLSPDQVLQIYRAVESLAVDGRGRLLPTPLKERFLEAACQLIMAGNEGDGKMRGRLEKLVTVFR